MLSFSTREDRPAKGLYPAPPEVCSMFAVYIKLIFARWQATTKKHDCDVICVFWRDAQRTNVSGMRRRHEFSLGKPRDHLWNRSIGASISGVKVSIDSG